MESCINATICIHDSVVTLQYENIKNEQIDDSESMSHQSGTNIPVLTLNANTFWKGFCMDYQESCIHADFVVSVDLLCGKLVVA